MWKPISSAVCDGSIILIGYATVGEYPTDVSKMSFARFNKRWESVAFGAPAYHFSRDLIATSDPTHWFDFAASIENPISDKCWDLILQQGLNDADDVYAFFTKYEKYKEKYIAVSDIFDTIDVALSASVWVYQDDEDHLTIFAEVSSGGDELSRKLQPFCDERFNCLVRSK